MRRHMKLVRTVLEYAECHATGRGIPAPEAEGYSVIQVNYHIRLCGEAGFLRIEDVMNMADDGPQYNILDLTWQGHEELGRLRNGI